MQPAVTKTKVIFIIMIMANKDNAAPDKIIRMSTAGDVPKNYLQIYVELALAAAQTIRETVPEIRVERQLRQYLDEI